MLLVEQNIDLVLRAADALPVHRERPDRPTRPSCTHRCAPIADAALARYAVGL